MRPDRGFTLIEVMVALVVGALVVLLAHRTFAEAGELARRVGAERRRHDAEMNARRFLSAAFAGLEVGTRGAGFRGLSDAVRFTTRLPGADTEEVRRTVTVAQSEGVLATVGLPPGPAAAAPDTLHLFPDAEALALDYLLDFGADALWVREWQSPVSAPLAVRLRLARRGGVVDTLLFFVGPRG